MSNHTFIIMSCEKNTRLHESICNYFRYEIEIQPLTIEQRQSYIDLFFHRFNKVSLKG